MKSSEIFERGSFFGTARQEREVPHRRLRRERRRRLSGGAAYRFPTRLRAHKYYDYRTSGFLGVFAFALVLSIGSLLDRVIDVSVFSGLVATVTLAHVIVWGHFLKNGAGEILLFANGDVRIINPLLSDDVNLEADQIKAMWIADDYSVKLNKWYAMSFFVSEERPGRVLLIALKKETRFPEVERLISLFSFPGGANTNRSMPSKKREVLYLAFLLEASNPSGSGLPIGDVEGAKTRAQAYL